MRRVSGLIKNEAEAQALLEELSLIKLENVSLEQVSIINLNLYVIGYKIGVPCIASLLGGLIPLFVLNRPK